MPSIYVKDYDTTVNFPDNTPPEVVKQALQKKFPPINAQQGVNTPATEPKTPKWAGDYPNTYGAYGAVKETVYPIAEGLALTAADIARVVNPAAGVALGAGAYTAVKGAERGISQLMGESPPTTTIEEFTNQAKDLKTGTEIMLTGGIIGKVISGGYQLLKKDAKGLWDVITRPFPAVTETGAMKKAGDILRETTPIDTLSKVAANNAAKVEEQIPDLQFSRGQRYANPSIIKEERAVIKSPGDAADIFTEKMAKNNQAIRQAWDKVNAGGDVEDLISLAKEKKALMNTKAAALAASPTTQETGGILRKQINTAADVAKQAHTEAYNAIPNVNVDANPIVNSLKEMETKINAVNAANYPVGIIEDIKSLMKSQNKLDEFAMQSYGKKWEDIAEKTKETLLKNIPELKAASQKQGIGFQDWLAIDKRLSTAIRDAGAGQQPNRELQRNLTTLKDSVTQILDTTGGNDNISGMYQKAKTLFKDYASKFYEGGVAKVRQKGFEAHGLKIAQSDVPSQFTNLDDADNLIKSIGLDNAKISMRDYFNSDLGNKLKGDLSPQNIGKWVFNNRAILNKYDLKNEYTDLLKISGDYKAVEKILGADVQSAMGAALGKGKDIGINAANLLKMTKDNPSAQKGLQKGFGDFLISEIENTEKTRAGNFVLSNAKIVNTLDKFKPAIDTIYKDNPEALKKLNIIQDAIQTMNNTAKSPVGGGSDTFELTASKYSGLMRYVGNRIGATVIGATTGSAVGGVIGASAGATVGMVGWDVLSKHSSANIERFMLKAMFDPEYANVLISMSRGAPKKYIEGQVGRLMATLGAYSYLRGNDNTLPPDIKAYKKSVESNKDPFGINEAQP